MLKPLLSSPFPDNDVRAFVFFTIPKSTLSNLRHLHRSRIKAVILPLVYVTLLISSWGINTLNLTFKMDFFYIIIRIQDTKHPSNSPYAELYLLLYIKSSSPTTVKFLKRSHQETQDYKSTTSSTSSGSGINFYSQIHKHFILPVPVITPANPGTTYTITHWQCRSCLRADTALVYGAGGRLSQLSNQCQYNRILAAWESENPESLDWSSWVQSISELVEVLCPIRHSRGG
jgi:hypothetical protein